MLPRCLGLLTFLAHGAAALAGAQPARWSVSNTPLAHLQVDSVGLDAGSVAGMARLTADRIAVLDSAASVLSVFDLAGRELRRWSIARDDSPGWGTSWLGRSHDSLFVFGPTSQQVLIFSASDSLTGVPFTAALGNAGWRPLARLANGAFVLQPIRWRMSVRGTFGPFRDTIALGLLPPLADSEVELGMFPFRSYAALPSGHGSALRLQPFPLGPALHVAAGTNRVWVGDSGRGSLVAFDASGTAVSRIEVPFQASPFNEAALRRVYERERERAAPDRRPAIDAMYGPRLRPVRTPLYSRLLADSNDAVWIQRFQVDVEAPSEVIVLGGDGRIVAQVSLPAGFVPYEVGSDHLLGTMTLSHGRVSIVLLGLLRE